MLPLGTPLPTFELREVVSGRVVASSELGDSVAVVAFICNHCPYVKHIAPALAEFGRWCKDAGVQIVGVCSNDPTTHPEDGPQAMAEEARQRGYTFPYLFDADQSVAAAFRAACTPEFYLFDRSGRLAYRGQFDSSRPGNGKPVTGADLRAAVDAVLSGHAPSGEQTASIGCSIKWQAGAAPDYAR
jgi:peroxiredoxin